MYQIGTLIIYLLTSLMALADSGLVDEVSCFDSLYKAKIANKKLLNGYIRLSHKVKNKHKGLYMVSHQDTFYCPLPSEASTQGRSYKSYDLKLQFHNDTKPILMTHTIQFDEVDLASTIGRIQRILASKTYKPVQCAQVKKTLNSHEKFYLKN